MWVDFKADCLPALVGSLPMDNHKEAADLIFDYTPQIPLWVQLPVFKEEGMVHQFMPGLPGIESDEDRIFINTASDGFSDELLAFYEEYMSVIGGETDIDSSRFVLTDDTASGFGILIEKLTTLTRLPKAVKGQITGPITFTTGVRDENKNPVFYHPELRDVSIKLLTLKAVWQVRQLSCIKKQVILFLDEPALAGFGTSEFTSMSRDDVMAALNEVIEGIHSEGGLAGIHVCANTDWSIILESSADIVNFDAYSYFDRFILYPDLIKKFIESGKILAWGIVPTGNIEDIEKETSDSLTSQFIEKARQIEDLGIDQPKIMEQSLITPSCGTGSLSLDLAKKVLKMTVEVSENLRRL